MKMQIDTNAKTIKVEGKVKLSDLFDQLQKFFPDGEWEDYDIETNTTIVWGNPIVIERHQPYPYHWWTTTGIEYQIPISSTSGTSCSNLNGSISNCSATTQTARLPDSGVYNIELN